MKYVHVRKVVLMLLLFLHVAVTVAVASVADSIAALSKFVHGTLSAESSVPLEGPFEVKDTPGYMASTMAIRIGFRTKLACHEVQVLWDLYVLWAFPRFLLAHALKQTSQLTVFLASSGVDGKAQQAAERPVKIIRDLIIHRLDSCQRGIVVVWDRQVAEVVDGRLFAQFYGLTEFAAMHDRWSERLVANHHIPAGFLDMPLQTLFGESELFLIMEESIREVCQRPEPITVSEVKLLLRAPLQPVMIWWGRLLVDAYVGDRLRLADLQIITAQGLWRWLESALPAYRFDALDMSAWAVMRLQCIINSWAVQDRSERPICAPHLVAKAYDRLIQALLLAPIPMALHERLGQVVLWQRTSAFRFIAYSTHKE